MRQRHTPSLVLLFLCLKPPRILSQTYCKDTQQTIGAHVLYCSCIIIKRIIVFPPGLPQTNTAATCRLSLRPQNEHPSFSKSELIFLKNFNFISPKTKDIPFKNDINQTKEGNLQISEAEIWIFWHFCIRKKNKLWYQFSWYSLKKEKGRPVYAICLLIWSNVIALVLT